MRPDENRLTIGGGTRILALIADPVSQVRSPAMVNALLERRGRFGAFVLVPMQVPRGALARTKGRGVHSGVPMLTAQMELMLRFMGVE
ncbi:MAG: hypothetical protein HYY35_05925 [Deltaproteobacteria bacterium]|nr:hypothetical protein [Deltaproteobacteria bacterium]